MYTTNSYLVGKKDNTITLLLEILIKNNDGVSSFYYELIVKLDKNDSIEILNIKEIDEAISYIYKSFPKDTLENKKLPSNITNYIIKEINSNFLKILNKEDIDNYKKIFNNGLLDNKRIKQLFYLLNNQNDYKEPNQYLAQKDQLKNFLNKTK